MGKFNRDNRREQRPYSRGSFNKQMYSATCSNCGKECSVPFKPSNGKPIFCSDCFERQDRGSERPQSQFSGEKRMYSAICDNCGNRCQVPFLPSKDKPIYCRKCFENRPEERGPKVPDQEQFEQINAKLDKILRLLTPSTTLAPKKIEEENKDTLPKKTASKRKNKK